MADASPYDASKRKPVLSETDLAASPNRYYFFYQCFLATLTEFVQTTTIEGYISELIPPPWFKGYFVPQLQFLDINADLKYAQASIEPFIYFWRYLQSILSNPDHQDQFPNDFISINLDPSGQFIVNPQPPSKFVLPSHFPLFTDPQFYLQLAPSSRYLSDSQKAEIFGWMAYHRYNMDDPDSPLVILKQPTSWDILLQNPTPHSVTYLALMHAVQRAIDSGKVKKEVKPIPAWLEILAVPERRDISWEAKMQELIVSSEFINEPDTYRNRKGFGPRTKYWESILTTASVMSRWWIGDPVSPSKVLGQVNALQSKVREVMQYELNIITSHGLKAQMPVEDPLSFLLDLCSRLTPTEAEIPDEINQILLGSNAREYIKLIQTAFTNRRPRNTSRADVDINANVGVTFRIWHPRWQSVYPEDSVLVDSDDNSGFSAIEPLVQARPPLFPWHISPEHGGPISDDGVPTDPAFTSPPDYLPLKYRAYDSYFTHPDDQMNFYQKMIAATENNPATVNFLPPPTWFDGFFLDRLNTGKWDVRRVTDDNKNWSFVDTDPSYKDGKKGVDDTNAVYSKLNELHHNINAQYYADQLAIVQAEDDYDGLDDPRSQYWFRMYYIHKSEKPKPLLLEFSHPPHYGKTHRFWKNLLHGIESVEGAVAGAATDLVAGGAKIFIRSASQLTSTILNETAKDIKPLLGSVANLGESILGGLGIKFPKGWGESAKKWTTILIFIVLAVIVLKLLTMFARLNNERKGSAVAVSSS